MKSWHERPVPQADPVINIIRIVVHGDETHWRIDGQSAQLWYAGNTQLGFFHADRSRGSEVAVSIFGSPFPGNLVADSYAGYNAISQDRSVYSAPSVNTH